MKFREMFSSKQYEDPKITELKEEQARLIAKQTQLKSYLENTAHNAVSQDAEILEGLDKRLKEIEDELKSQPV